MEKQRHLHAVDAIEAIDRGLAEAEQITIEDGIREAIRSGRMTPEIGKACIEAYRRTTTGQVIELRPDYPDGAA